MKTCQCLLEPLLCILNAITLRLGLQVKPYLKTKSWMLDCVRNVFYTVSSNIGYLVRFSEV